jgi:hypothetical protein
MICAFCAGVRADRNAARVTTGAFADAILRGRRPLIGGGVRHAGSKSGSGRNTGSAASLGIGAENLTLTAETVAGGSGATLNSLSKSGGPVNGGGGKLRVGGGGGSGVDEESSDRDNADGFVISKRSWSDFGSMRNDDEGYGRDSGAR